MNSVSSHQVLARNWEIIILKIKEIHWGSCHDFRLKKTEPMISIRCNLLCPHSHQYTQKTKKKVIGQNKVFQYGSMTFYKDCREEVWDEIMWFNLNCGCINMIKMCSGEKYIELIQGGQK